MGFLGLIIDMYFVVIIYIFCCVLKSVFYVVGVNNYMGSVFIGEKDVMMIIMEEIKC